MHHVRTAEGSASVPIRSLTYVATLSRISIPTMSCSGYRGASLRAESIHKTHATVSTLHTIHVNAQHIHPDSTVSTWAGVARQDIATCSWPANLDYCKGLLH